MTLFHERRRAALELLRSLARDDAKSHSIKLSRHAQDRMAERGIVFTDVLRTLRIGDPINADEAGQNEGEVKLDIAFRPKGAREMVLVTLVVTVEEKVFIKTVMWRDER